MFGVAAALFYGRQKNNDEKFIVRIVDPQREELKLYWKNNDGEILKNFGNLKNSVESRDRKLVLAMNAGMFRKDFSPQGLFIEDGKTLAPLDTSAGEGNFYLQPNGVFFITKDNLAKISVTSDFKDHGEVKYATQSGPMLVINGEIHPAFTPTSTNLYIRNGVGILPDNRVIFVISTNKVNLYEFAEFFKNTGCRNALYLDGYVSKIYLPAENFTRQDGDFGAMIGVTEPQNQ